MTNMEGADAGKLAQEILKLLVGAPTNVQKK